MAKPFAFIGGFTRRASFLWGATTKGTRTAFGVLVVVLSILSNATWLWDELFPKHQRPKLILLLPHWPWWGWAIAGLGMLCTVLLDHAYTRSVDHTAVVLDPGGTPIPSERESPMIQRAAMVLFVIVFLVCWVWNFLNPLSTSSQIDNFSVAAVPRVPPSQPEPGSSDTHVRENIHQSQAGGTSHPLNHPKYKIEVSGVIISTYDNRNDARIQITVTVNNPGSPSFAHDWSLTAKFPDRTVDGEHLIGDAPVPGSVNLPTLDGQQFTADKPVYGLLYFMLPHLTPDEINELKNCQLNGKAYPVQLELMAKDASAAIIGMTQIPMDELLSQSCSGQRSGK